MNRAGDKSFFQGLEKKFPNLGLFFARITGLTGFFTTATA
jgi:hypothetical protein